MIKIQTIAKKLGIKASDLFCYGPYIAKVMTKDEPIKKEKSKINSCHCYDSYKSRRRKDYDIYRLD